MCYHNSLNNITFKHEFIIHLQQLLQGNTYMDIIVD